MLPGKIGDAFTATAVVKAIYREEAPCAIDWLFESELSDAFQWLSTTDVPVRRFYGVKSYPGPADPVYHRDWLARSPRHWSRNYPGYDLYLNATLPGRPPKYTHLVDLMARQCGIRRLAPIDTILHSAEPIIDGGYVLVHAGGAIAEKRCPELMEALWPTGTISVGFKDEPTPPSTKAVTPASFAELARLVCSARAVMGVSSSVVNLAVMLGKPTFCFHRITDERQGIAKFGGADIRAGTFSKADVEELAASCKNRLAANDKPVVLN